MPDTTEGRVALVDASQSVLSNDRFRERQDAFPEVMQRIIRYMIVEGEVVLEKRSALREED